MKLNHFTYFPGGDEEPVASMDENVTNNEQAPKEEKKGFFAKIRQALQDWSNQDQADQEYDDSRV